MRYLIPIVLFSLASVVAQKMFFPWVETLPETNQQEVYFGCLIGFAIGLVAGLVVGIFVGKKINWTLVAIFLVSFYSIFHFATTKVFAIGLIVPCFFLFMMTYFFVMYMRFRHLE